MITLGLEQALRPGLMLKNSSINYAKREKLIKSKYMKLSYKTQRGKILK
jgi:hypothetical protein